MRLIELQLDGTGTVIVNPEQVSHLQAHVDKTLMWLVGDSMPTILNEPYLEVMTQVNEAMEDEMATAIHNGDCEHIENAKALIHEIRRLQWAFGCAALAFFVLLLVIVGRAHG